MRLPLDIASVKGFMPEDEGAALYDAFGVALQDSFVRMQSALGVEIGSYCGKSSVYLGAAAREYGGRLLAIDHHKGSEENQVGEEYHDPDLVSATGGIDSLPHFRDTILRAGLEDMVTAFVAPSAIAAPLVEKPLCFLFIDGGHSRAAAQTDYRLWTPKLVGRGILAIHDVFPNPKDGGRPPFEIYTQALESKTFEEVSATGSLRVLRKTL